MISLLFRFIYRRRFGFIDRIITFFTGKPLTYQPPALESPTPNETEPTESNVSPIPDPIPYADQPASPKVSPASPPKPAEKPILKPAPAPPAAKPAGPPKTAAPEPQPKVDLPPTPEPKPEPKKQPKPVPTPKVEPTPAPKPSKPLEPVSNGHSKAPEPAKVAAAPAELVKLTDDSANSHPSAAASIAVELPGSNEDSFIIVEKQKPKPADNIPTTPTATINKAAVNVKNSTLDFLKAEGGGRGASAVAGPATPR